MGNFLDLPVVHVGAGRVPEPAVPRLNAEIGKLCGRARTPMRIPPHPEQDTRWTAPPLHQRSRPNTVAGVRVNRRCHPGGSSTVRAERPTRCARSLMRRDPRLRLPMCRSLFPIYRERERERHARDADEMGWRLESRLTRTGQSGSVVGPRLSSSQPFEQTSVETFQSVPRGEEGPSIIANEGTSIILAARSCGVAKRVWGTGGGGSRAGPPGR